MGGIQGHKKYNFDPQNYTTPEFKKKDGEYRLTDYQSAITVRNWMHKNIPGQMLGGSQFNQAVTTGSITIGGKTITLTEQERAAFSKFTANTGALFSRLDGGENGTHDRYMGAWDIDAGIKNGRLHGTAEHSKERYWRNRNDEMAPGKAGQVLSKFFSDKFGANWPTMTQDQLFDIANRHYYKDPKNPQNLIQIDDPEVIRAAGVLYDNWGKVQDGEGNSVGTLSKREVDKLTML